MRSGFRSETKEADGQFKLLNTLRNEGETRFVVRGEITGGENDGIREITGGEKSERNRLRNRLWRETALGFWKVVKK